MVERHAVRVGSTFEAPARAALANFLASLMPLILESDGVKGVRAELTDKLMFEADTGVIDDSGVTSADSCSDSVMAEAVAMALAVRKPARA